MVISSQTDWMYIVVCSHNGILYSTEHEPITNVRIIWLNIASITLSQRSWRQKE